MAASDLTLPATVATELAGGVVSGDARLPRLIAVASAAILGHLNRKQLHYSAAYAESVPGYGRQRMLLSLTPVTEVTSIALDGSTVDATTYEIDDSEAGLLYRASGWDWTGRNRGGLPPQTDPDMGTEESAYLVTYKGGYVTPDQAASVGWAGPVRSLPYDLEEACIQTVVGLYRNGGQAGDVASEQLGDYAVSYRGPNSIIGIGMGGIIPDRVIPLLAKYARPIG